MRRGVSRRDAAQLPVRATERPYPLIRAGSRQSLVELIERATRRQVTLVFGPGGTGKTTAVSLWAVAQLGSLVVWLTLVDDDDQLLFWARLYDGLARTAAAPSDALQMLAEVTAQEFPLRLAELARSFVKPVVIVIDNAHAVTSNVLLAGLDMLMRNAPPNLRIVLAGRYRPALRQLARMQAAGDVTIIGPAELACGAVR